jgi:hypothetical protein
MFTGVGACKDGRIVVNNDSCPHVERYDTQAVHNFGAPLRA